MKLYFAYGANLNLDGMARRCPDANPIKSMFLKDWKLSFNGVATILPSLGSQVPGALWELTKKCEDALDLFEGYPFLYNKITLDQDGHKFMVYVMNHNSPHSPNDSYFNTILTGYNEWNLPEEHLFETAKKTKESVHNLKYC